MSSLTITELLHSKCDIYTKREANEFGEGSSEQYVVRDAKCRFVEHDVQKFDKSQGGVVVIGNAEAWLNGDQPVKTGMIYIDKESGKKFRIVNVSKPRDLIVRGVDHTKLILE